MLRINKYLSFEHRICCFNFADTLDFFPLFFITHSFYYRFVCQNEWMEIKFILHSTTPTHPCSWNDDDDGWGWEISFSHQILLENFRPCEFFSSFSFVMRCWWWICVSSDTGKNPQQIVNSFQLMRNDDTEKITIVSDWIRMRERDEWKHNLFRQKRRRTNSVRSCGKIVIKRLVDLKYENLSVVERNCLTFIWVEWRFFSQDSSRGLCVFVQLRLQQKWDFFLAAATVFPCRKIL